MPAADVRPRRVLVVSADMGAGHNATAAALEREIEQRWPGSQVTRVETLDVMGAAAGPLLRRIYITNVESTPWLYELFYASLWRHLWFAEASKRLTGSWAGRRLAPIISSVDPDFIVSTYPLGSSGLAWLRRRRGLTVPVGAWVSDFAPHPFWVYGDMDLTVVIHEVSAETAQAAGPTASVIVGILPTLVATPAQRTPGPHTNGRFTILVACGSYSFGNVVDMITEVLAASPAVRVVAACGRDISLLRRLQLLDQPTDRLLVLGWTNDMAERLAAADVLITNGGGVTALEALSVGTPILMYQPIAAHGAANADLMVVAGVADLVTDRRHLSDYIHAVTSEVRPEPGELRPEPREIRPEPIEGRPKAAGELRPEPVEGRHAGPAHPRPSLEPDGLQRLANLPSSTSPMAPNDAFFAYLDSCNVRQELGVVVELCRRPDGTTPSLSDIRAEIIRAFRDVPAMHRGLVRTVGPRWRRYPDIALDQQVRILTPQGSAPGQASQQQILSAVTAFWSEPLPDNGPAWAAGLVQDAETGRSLVAIKLHHSMADGVAALPILDRLFGGDTTPESLVSRERSATWLRGPFRIVTGLASLAAHGLAHRQPLTDRSVGQHRVLVTWDAPCVEFLAAARRLGVRPHELALGLMAEALSRLLVPAGLVDSDSPLRVMVPMTMRGGGDQRIGNRTGAIAVDLPLEPMTFQSRLDKIITAIRRHARRGEPQAAYTVMRLVDQLPPRLHAAVARHMYHRRFFHAILTYLPGPRQPRSLAEAPVRAVFPFLPLAPTVPLTAGVLTFDATACVGVQLDASLNLPTESLRQALDGAWNVLARAAASTTSADAPHEDRR